MQPKIIILLPEKSNYCPKNQFSAKKIHTVQKKKQKNLLPKKVTLVPNKINLVPKNLIYQRKKTSTDKNEISAEKIKNSAKKIKKKQEKKTNQVDWICSNRVCL